MQTKITVKSVNDLRGRRDNKIITDTEIKGFVARYLPTGVITYGYRYRNREGKQRWLPLGLHGQITPDEARKLAKIAAAKVAAGDDPADERQTAKAFEKNSVNTVLDTFLKRYVHAQGLRSAKRIEHNFDRLVRPLIGSRSIYDLKRRELIELFDDIEDNNGAPMSHQVLAQLRQAFQWWAGRDDTFASPFVDKMRRAKPGVRTRVLNDDELRDLWQSLDDTPLPRDFPALIRILLLTACRRDEVAGMHDSELERAGDTSPTGAPIWTIPESRYKTKRDHVVPLTAAVLALLPDREGFIFPNRDGGSFSSFSRAKAGIDAAIAKQREREGREAMPEWTIHDLRRTARSLMSRARVLPDIAERVLGHALPGIRGVYDCHEYASEKREALEALAAFVDGIVNPPAGAVVPFPRLARVS